MRQIWQELCDVLQIEEAQTASNHAKNTRENHNNVQI